jgi:hypothetical protein
MDRIVSKERMQEEEEKERRKKRRKIKVGWRSLNLF